METIGLVLNFIGAFILAYSANLQGDLIANIIESVIPGFGRFDMKTFTPDEIQKLKKTKRLSSWLNIIGYLLFVGGFGLQILGLLHR